MEDNKNRYDKLKEFNKVSFKETPSIYVKNYWLLAINPNIESSRLKNDQKEIFTGKWCIFGSKNKIDKIWKDMESIIEEDVVRSMKVRSGLTAENSPQYKNKAVICVYVHDYREQEAVFKLRDLIRKIGVKSVIKFKTDQSTIERKYGTHDEFLYIDKLTSL